MTSRAEAGRAAARAGRIEWIVAAVSTAVVLALVGALLREALRDGSSPPDLRIALAAAEVHDGRAQVRFTLTNHGGRTAASVAIALVVREGGGVLDVRRLTVDYVAGGSEVSGGFSLDGLPDGVAPVAVVEGYVDP